MTLRRPPSSAEVPMRWIGLVVVLVLGLLSPLAPQAQQSGKVHRVGYLGYDAPGSDPSGIAGLRQGLRELGYLESRNIVIEYRFAEDRPDRLPGLITELTNLKVGVLITQGAAVTAAAQKATTTMPIVSVSADPLGLGFVESLAHPGGNITGLSLAQSEDFSGKWLELIRDSLPKASRVGIIWNPANRSLADSLKQMELLAPRFGLQLSSHTVRSAADIDAAFAAVSRAHIAALIVQTDPLVVSQKSRLVGLATAGRIPTFYGIREFVDAGGLMSYGPSLFDIWRRAATYVDRILKGSKPADLPVEQPTKFELVINLKTAKALGLTIPQSLLLRADEIIQ
jgi:putative tryptophan/tyrosine transport system substrate-binding protein